MRSDSASLNGLALVRQAPEVRTLGTEVRWIASTGSTNDDLKALARAGAAEGLVLVTDEQTAGRGRRGRSWQAPPATSLLQSILLRPTWLVAKESFLLTVLAAVAAAEAIEATVGVPVMLKWPNDLEYQGRKLGGILVEAELRDLQLEWAILGIGLNVNWDPATLPELAERATSLAAISATPVDRGALFVALLQQLDLRYAALREGAQTALYEAWRGRLSTLGCKVQAETVEGPLIGTAVGVDRSGGLQIRTAGGTLHTVHAGDVSVRAID